MGMKLALALLIVMAVMTGGFYLYYKDSQKRIAVLTENAAKAELAVVTQKETIVAMNENYNKQARLVGDLTSKLSEAEDGYKKLSSKLRRHDLEELSRAKPKSMEIRINKGTKRLLNELEEISGAKKPKKLNSSK
jgi:flagellar basal body-associated protein FliL